MQSNIRNEIVELDLNEIETVAGGATYTYSATLTSTSTSLSSTYIKPTMTTTYVRPTMTTTSMSLSSSLLSDPRLI